MPLKVKAKFLNRDVVMARLRALLPETEKELAAAQMEAATELADAIKPRAPVRTGKYRASIRAGRLADKPRDARFVAGKTKDPNATGIYAWYGWRWLEFGTVKMKARPHILPTYRAARKKIRQKMANAVNRAVKKAKAK